MKLFFPRNAYNLDSRVNGAIEDNNGHPKFIATWYEFIVTSRALKLPKTGNATQKQTSCIVKINAPGSRSLTSDIDTSIGASIEGDAEKFLALSDDRIKKNGPDYEGRIRNAMIANFYLISEEEFGMTSGEHRDSNAYADLSTNEDFEYPKFKNDDIKNPIIGDDRLFSAEEFAKHFSECKLKKHRLEIAASLFSVHVALGPSEWENFKKQVEQTVEECANLFWEQDESQESSVSETKGSYIKASTQDIQEIFKLTERFFSTYEEELKKEKHTLKNSHRKQDNLNQSEKERDLEVSALNRLYVKHLEEMTFLNGEILKLKQINEVAIPNIILNKENLKEAEEKRLHYKEKPTLFKKELEDINRECASIRQIYESEIKQLKDNYKKIADLELQKLEKRYQAHTFANEAYVCRSAVYHVVKGMQQGEAVSISEQTLLGSALQQIGFKLLHTQELRKREKTEGEIAYRTAKYSQRVHQLIFGAQNVTDTQIQSLFKRGFVRNKPNIFPYLKAKDVQRGSDALFNKEELLLLNTELKIIKEK